MTMEMIGGATVAWPDEGGAIAEAERGPLMLGPEQNDGAYVAMIGAGRGNDKGPPLHFHPHTDEGFYIGDGEMTFEFEDREFVAGTGTFVFVPRGLVHTARNAGDAPMRGLIIISPGAAEHVFEYVRSEPAPER